MAGSRAGAELQRALLAGEEHLLAPGVVAILLNVDPKTVSRWANMGKLTSVRTPGGHRRLLESEVQALLDGDVLIGARAVAE